VSSGTARCCRWACSSPPPPRCRSRDRQIHVGKVPRYSVVVPGNLGGAPNRPSTYCAVIVKTVDERTRSKTSINELLRD